MSARLATAKALSDTARPETSSETSSETSLETVDSATIPAADAMLAALADAVLLVDGGDAVGYANPAAEAFFEAGAA